MYDSQNARELYSSNCLRAQQGILLRLFITFNYLYHLINIIQQLMVSRNSLKVRLLLKKVQEKSYTHNTAQNFSMKKARRSVLEIVDNKKDVIMSEMK